MWIRKIQLLSIMLTLSHLSAILANKIATTLSNANLTLEIGYIIYVFKLHGIQVRNNYKYSQNNGDYDKRSREINI